MVEVLFTKEGNWKVYLIMFMLYSTLGCICEHVLYRLSSKKKYLKNPIMEGFPLYGIGAYLAVFISRGIQYYENKTGTKVNILVEFIVYALVITLLEYLAGRLVGVNGDHNVSSCGINYWDYSKNSFNFQGIIDLQHFVIYGFLGLIVTRAHPKIVGLVNKMFG